MLSFLGRGQLTTGVRYLPAGGVSGGGAFGFVKQGNDFGVLTGGAAGSGALAGAPPGRWYHVAYVAAPVGNVAADGTAATRGILYVDGQVIASSPSDVVPPPLDTGLYVGGQPEATAIGAGFHGVVDEVRVYAAALSSEEVNEQMWSSDSPSAVSLALDPAAQASKSLKVHLRFNNLTGSVVPDHVYDDATNVTFLATSSDAAVIMAGGGDAFTSPGGGVSGGGAAWMKSDAPWEPAELVSVSGPREGRLRGGATITLRGRNFAASSWSSCVFGDVAEEKTGVPLSSTYGRHPTLDACAAAPTVPRTSHPPRVFNAPGGASVTGVSVPATPVPGEEGTAVTCQVPAAKDGLPRVVDVAVSNGPVGLRGATRGVASFVYRESSLEFIAGGVGAGADAGGAGAGAGGDSPAAAAMDASDALTAAAAEFGSSDAGDELRSYTVSLWVRPSASSIATHGGGPAAVFSFKTGGGGGGVSGDGATTVSVTYDGEKFAYSDDAIGVVEAPTSASPGEWHFVVLSVSVDGSGVLGVDAAGAGALAAAAAGFTTVSRPRGGGPGDALLFAPRAGDGGDTRRFLGHVDEIRVYSVSLNANQLVTLPTCTGVQCPFQGLVAHYNFADEPVNATGGTGTGAGGSSEQLFATPASPSNGPRATIDAASARWVLSEGPWLPAHVHRVVPASPRMRREEAVTLVGANFAPSRWLAAPTLGPALTPSLTPTPRNGDGADRPAGDLAVVAAPLPSVGVGCTFKFGSLTHGLIDAWFGFKQLKHVIHIAFKCAFRLSKFRQLV